MTNEGNVKKLAKQCYYYGCAGTMICTYYSWTTSCTYPKCNKKDLSTNKSAYEATKKKEIEL